MKDDQSDMKSNTSLSLTEPLFRAVLDNLSEGIAICSPLKDKKNNIVDLIYDYVNDALSIMIKLDKGFMTGRKMSEVIAGFSESELFKSCCQVIDTGSPVKCSSMAVSQTIADHKIEGYFDLSITNCSGKVVITLQDVTEAKKKEAELESSREDINLLFENSFDALFLTSPDGNIYKVNSAAEKLFGYTEEEICRLGRIALTDTSDPSWEKALEERARTGRYVGPLRYRRKDGTTFIGEVSSIIFKMKDGSFRTSTALRDITERLETEKKVRLVSRQLQNIIDGAPNLVFAKDLQGRFIIINRKLEELLGVSNEELRGKTDFDIFPKEWAEYYQEHDRRIVESGKPMEIEEEADLADGVHHCFLANKFPLYDENGNIYAVCGISTDITNQKRMETELRQSEEKFRLLAERLPIFIWSADSNGKVDLVTGQFEEHNQYLFETKDGWSWETAVHPDDRQRSVDCWTHSIKTGEEYLQVHRMMKNSGEYVWKLVRANPVIDNSGKIIRWYGTTVDINEQKRLEESLRESEDRFRIVQEVSPDGFTILKPVLDQAGKVTDFIFVYENPAVAKMNGTIPEEVVGHSLLEFFPGHIDTKFFQTYKEVYDSGRTIEFEDHYQGETITEEKWFRIVVVKIRDGIAILAQDITERKQFEIKLQNTFEELKRSNKELEQFAYVASHDLQEPLRMVSNYLGMLERKYKDQLDDNAKQYIYFAVDGSKRMAELIHDLLSYSRLTTKSEPFRVVDFNAVLSDVRRDLQIAIMETRTKLETDPMPELKADAFHIRQLFQNLIQNAIKFRNNHNPYIKISAELKGSEWIFGVKDNGMGIKPEHHERIFMLFQRLHERDKYPGTGLGLAICKKIVEQHGGRIWVESDEGQGSTFFFSIPR